MVSSTEMKQIFDRKYRKKLWPGGLADGTLSGAGSTMQATEPFRAFLPRFIREHQITSFFDAPCGDFHWMKEVPFEPGLRYFGGDISETVIADVQRKYSTPDRLFFTFDIGHDPFFDVDVWLCRDCFFHLTLETALNSLRNAMRARMRYIMLTSHCDIPENKEISETGKYRRLDLLKPPFSLPEPILRCDEFAEQANSRRFVGVWATDAIRGAVC